MKNLAFFREMTTGGAGNLNASYVKVSRVHGTRPYLPDEYLRSKKLSTKVDTYSFGIVLFELASGLRAYEEHRPKKFLVIFNRKNEPGVSLEYVLFKFSERHGRGFRRHHG